MNMENFDQQDYKIFDLFRNQWALVTAGDMEHFNTCTVSWGSMGTLWTKADGNGSVITVYIHPGRYTCEFMKESDTFTVSFFPQEQKKALGYLGSHSGRDEDKVAAAGLTPVPCGEGVTFAEASVTFTCKKLYQHPFDRDSLAPEIQEYYKANPKVYPVDENGQWQAHWVFVGQIIGVEEK